MGQDARRYVDGGSKGLRKMGLFRGQMGAHSDGEDGDLKRHRGQAGMQDEARK